MLQVLFSATATLLLLLISAEARHEHDDSFYYFTLAREWGISYCDTESCTPGLEPKSAEFTLHGLWPSYEDKPLGPMFCPGRQFNPDLIADLLPELKSEWPSFKKTEEGFLAHEWKKHGACAKPILKDELAYFSKALELHEQYNLLSYLTEAGLEPTDYATYEIKKLLAAFDAGVKMPGSSQLQCKEGELVEVYTCLSKSFHPIPCPKAPPPGGYCPEMLVPTTPKRNRRPIASS